MPIETTTLAQYGEQQLVAMSPDETLQAAMVALQASGHAENKTYLVVQLAEKEAAAMPFADLLPQVIQPLGYDSLAQPLRELPLSPADLVVRTDIPQSGLEVVDWVAARPQSMVVVVDDTGVVGLLTNANRSGAVSFSGGHFDGLSLLGLHGELAQSSQPHATFTQRVSPPTCPKCGQSGFAMFKQKQYHCAEPDCDHKQDQAW
ncbi:hypothetical protein QUF58_03915 [Anaerolineales bacterium HSG24]|nr:hypothetical protein [Anaerolineales bacterium HSG24]